MDQRAFALAKSICNFLMERSKKPNGYKGMPPEDDFAYGAAIANWERKNKPHIAYFSTEDPHMLHYKAELSLHFGLRVVTRDEAAILDLQQPTIVTKVHQATWLEELGITDPFGNESSS